MPWCPKCKLEYVEGIKVCPDCQTALVDSLDDISEDVDFDVEEEIEEKLDEALHTYLSDATDEDREMMIENIKRAAMIPKYKSKAEALSEHKSGAVSLTIVGLFGIAFVVLSALNLIKLPISGSTLTNIVMGVLFLIFLVSGIISFAKASKLKPEAVKEEELIKEVVDFVKEKKLAGAYKVDKGSENFETDYIRMNEKIVSDIEEKFPDLEPGFSYYVADRFLSEIIDED